MTCALVRIAIKIRVIAEGLYPTLPSCGSPFTFLSPGLLVLAVALVFFVCNGLAVCVRNWHGVQLSLRYGATVRMARTADSLCTPSEGCSKPK